MSSVRGARRRHHSTQQTWLAAMFTLGDIPTYGAMPSTVADVAALVSPSDACVALRADANANAQMTRGAATQGEVAGAAAALARDLALARDDRLCVSLAGSDGAAFLLQLAALAQGACVVLPGAIKRTVRTDSRRRRHRSR